MQAVCSPLLAFWGTCCIRTCAYRMRLPTSSVGDTVRPDNKKPLNRKTWVFRRQGVLYQDVLGRVSTSKNMMLEGIEIKDE